MKTQGQSITFLKCPKRLGSGSFVIWTAIHCSEILCLCFERTGLSLPQNFILSYIFRAS